MFTICRKAVRNKTEKKNTYRNNSAYLLFTGLPHQDGLVVNMSASHVLSGGFAPWPVIPKTITDMVKTASLLGT